MLENLLIEKVKGVSYMNDKQINLLKQLYNVLIKLESECENDNQFNSKLSELNIFANSLDEVIAILDEKGVV